MAAGTRRNFYSAKSYGTPRTCVLTWLLHEDGVDLNGIVLQSSILDYSQPSIWVGIFPTFAADALFHGKAKVHPPPTDLAIYLKGVETFAERVRRGDGDLPELRSRHVEDRERNARHSCRPARNSIPTSTAGRTI